MLQGYVEILPHLNRGREEIASVCAVVWLQMLDKIISKSLYLYLTKKTSDIFFYPNLIFQSTSFENWGAHSFIYIFVFECGLQSVSSYPNV